ncbi:MAG: protein kinase [Polyangiaceae bacterium]
MQPPPENLLAGRYELHSVAGKGGMATVWRATMHGLYGFRKPVAIKLMHTHLSKDPQFVQMFVEEARVSSRLTHPNIAQVLDFGVDQRGKQYLAMEWVEGLDLIDYAGAFERAATPTPWVVAVLVLVEVLKALAAAHEHTGDDGYLSPVFHRDVTPHNMLLGVSGAVKLTDFGLARAADRGVITAPDMIKGKLSYTAPEMTRGAPPNAQTDIFAAGVSLYEVLMGKKLFDAQSPAAAIKQIQAFQSRAVLLGRGDVPANLATILRRALAADPRERYTSARAFANDLVKLLPRMPEIDVLGASVRAARAHLLTGAPLDKGALMEVSVALSVPDPSSLKISVDLGGRDTAIDATLRSEDWQKDKKIEIRVEPVVDPKKKRSTTDRRPPPAIEVRPAPPARQPAQAAHPFARTDPVFPPVPRNVATGTQVSDLNTRRRPLDDLGATRAHARAAPQSVDIDVAELTSSQTRELAAELAEDPTQQPPTAVRPPRGSR